MLGNLGRYEYLYANSTIRDGHLLKLDCTKFDDVSLGLSYTMTELQILQTERSNINVQKMFGTKKALRNRCNVKEKIETQFSENCLQKSKCTFDNIAKEMPKKCKKPTDPRNAIFLRSVCTAN
jgi:hypothetical protein